MHFHVPKPIHGWRQFFNEVAVIAVGIAIALICEQLLEKWNEHHQAGKALAAIQDEVGNNTGSLKARMATEDCINHRLDEIAAYVEKPSMPRPKWVGRPQLWVMNSSAVQAARSYGSLTELSRDEQMTISDIYGGFDAINDFERDEQWAWAELRSITEDRDITDVDQASLRQAIQRARLASWAIHVNAKQVMASANKLHAAPNHSIIGSTSVCVPMTTPFEQAEKQSGGGYGEPR